MKGQENGDGNNSPVRKYEILFELYPGIVLTFSLPTGRVIRRNSYAKQILENDDGRDELCYLGEILATSNYDSIRKRLEEQQACFFQREDILDARAERIPCSFQSFVVNHSGGKSGLAILDVCSERGNFNSLGLRLRSANYCSEYFVLVDQEGRLSAWNSPFEDFLGYSSDFLRDTTLSDHVIPGHQSKIEDALDQSSVEKHFPLSLALVAETGQTAITEWVGDWMEAEDRRMLAITGRRKPGAKCPEERSEDRLTSDTTRLEELKAALTRTIEAKDEYTGQHLLRVGRYASQLGASIGLSEQRIEQLRVASVLHDIGKVGVPDQIFSKTEDLSEKEWQLIERHPRIGQDIVGQVSQLNHAATVIGEHHEYYDGAGYPEGLAGEDITPEARALSVIDAYDAMRSDRPYRDALPPDMAVEELQQHSGSQFDPQMVEAFLDVLEVEQMEA